MSPSSHRRVTTALSVLTSVAEAAGPMTVSEVAREHGLSVSTTSRLAADLASCGVLARGKGAEYELGDRAFGLAGLAAAPYLVELQVALGRLIIATGETVGVLAEAPRRRQQVTEPGARVVCAAVPHWSVSAATHLGSWLPDPSGTVRAAFDAPLGHRARKVHTGTNLAGVVDRIAPFRWGEGRPFGALVVRTPDFRDSTDGRAEFVLQLAQARLDHHLAEFDPAPPDEMTHDPDASSLEVALRLLELVAARPGIRTSRLAGATGVSSERAARLLRSGHQAGLVQGDAESGHRATLRLGGWYPAEMSRRLVCRSADGLRQLSREHGISAYLTTLVGAKSVTVAESVVSSELRTASWLHRPFPLTGSDGAPALLAALPDTDIVDLFDVTPRGSAARGLPGTAAEFLQVVGEVRKTGSAVISEYGENGLSSVTAPVSGLAGDVAAAVCLVGPPGDVEPRGSQLRRAVSAAADGLGRALAGR